MNMNFNKNGAIDAAVKYAKANPQKKQKKGLGIGKFFQNLAAGNGNRTNVNNAKDFIQNASNAINNAPPEKESGLFGGNNMILYVVIIAAVFLIFKPKL